MAVTLKRVTSSYDVDHEIWAWLGLAQGEVGPLVVCGHKQDKTFYIKAASPGSGTLTLEGTPDPGLQQPETPPGLWGWAVLHDPRGPGAGDLTALPLGSVPITRQCLELAYAVRPNVNGGFGAEGVDVWLVMKGRG